MSACVPANGGSRETLRLTVRSCISDDTVDGCSESRIDHGDHPRFEL